jgi:hypothetical protein
MFGMQHEYHEMNHHTINESFYSEHPKVYGPVRVFNSNHFLIAEYCIKTGIATWQRVIPVAQRDNVETWLGIHYPVPALV